MGDPCIMRKSIVENGQQFLVQIVDALSHVCVHLLLAIRVGNTASYSDEDRLYCQHKAGVNALRLARALPGKQYSGLNRRGV